MIYNLREDTYDDDDLDALSPAELELLRADVKAERAHMQADVKGKQFEFKSGRGPGLTSAEHARREAEISDLLAFESQLEYIQAQRAAK